MSRRSSIWCVLLAALLTTAALGAPQSRRMGREMGRPGQDPIAVLKQALTDSGADSLSSTQEEQVQQVITSFRDSQVPPAPDDTVMAARNAYQHAVLSGDAEAAKTAAATLAQAQAAGMQTRLAGQAAVMIQIMAILTQGQVEKLVGQFGTEGLFRTLQRLVGPPMGRRGGPGPGPGFAPPGM